MNFYQELGVSAKATETEIRRSYKRLTQLVHPDHQHQDQELRALAEAQMKRLNEMIAILTDPEQRRSYDRSIAESSVIVIQNALRKYSWKPNNRGWLFLVLLLVLFGLSAWLVPLFDDTRFPARVTLHLPIPPPPSTPPHSPNRSITPVKKQIPAIPDQVTGLLPPPELRDTPPAPIGDPIRNMLLPPSAPLPATPSLLGRWVYSPNSGDSTNPKLYAPVYVELAMTEAGGVLHGLYRSRYKVPDRAVNPVVNFVFDGTSADSTFVWRGDGGAKGEITTNLESPAKLKIAWFASTMGSALSLGAGTATLYRFR